jgi:proton-dependent oligopeptide transporter, POT family
MSEAAVTEEVTATEAEEQLSLKDNFRILFKASRAFWMVNMVNFGDGIAYFGILNLLTIFIAHNVGFSDHATGIAVSVFTGVVTLFMFGGGFISDKLGVRKALTFSLALVLVGRLLLMGSPLAGAAAAMTLWIGLMIMGVAEGVIQPALYAGVKEFTDPRTATIGYSILYAIMNVGIAAEAFVSPFIRERSSVAAAQKFGIPLSDKAKEWALQAGVSNVFWAMVVFTVVLLLANILFFSKKIEDRDRVVAYVAKPKEHDSRSLGQKIRALPFMDSRFIFFIFILLPVRTLFAHQWLTLPDYILRCFPENVGARYEWFQGLNPVIIIIFVPLIAAMTRRANIITMMIIGTSISALTTFILVPGPNLWSLIAYVVLFSFGEAVWSSRFLEYVANLAPAGQVGAYMGLAGIPWFLAKMTTGLYSGRMIEIFIPKTGAHDSGTMWLIYAFIAMITPVGLIIGKRWVEKGVKETH